MSAGANAYRVQGNDLFKAGAFLKASELYSKAEEADAGDPVYPSNLSAALFELGDYSGCVAAGIRAWKLLEHKPDEKIDLVTRISTRLAKALCHGVRAGKITGDDLHKYRADIDHLRVASIGGASNNADALLRAWGDCSATEAEVDDYEKKGNASLSRLARLPMFFKPLDHTKEYYMFGHDDVKDLTAGWGERFPQPLDFSEFSAEDIQELAFMFGGVGDARHALATLCGLRRAHDALPGEKQASFRAHLTLLDINEVSVARNLCLFMLIDGLNHTTDATEQTEIKATLMYIFCGAVMPSYCYQRLERLFHEIPARLRTDANLPVWMHVDTDTIASVSNVFDYWLAASKPTERMLAIHEIPAHRSRRPPRTFRTAHHSDPTWTLHEKMAAERAEIRDMLLHMSHEKLVQSGLVSPMLSAAAAHAELCRNMDEIVDGLQETMFGNAHTFEVEWYEKTKVFLPPEELWSRHAEFATAWKQVQDIGDVERPTLRKVTAHIESEWRTNITLFAPYYDDPQCRYGEAQTGYPDMRLNPFDIIEGLNKYTCRDKEGSGTLQTLAFDVCSTFFEEIASALKQLESHITLEFRVGGLVEELAKMRCADHPTRLARLPRKYTRMWLSNVPDYTHGSLNMFVYVVPSLQDNPQAAVACNCLLNTSVWKDDEEFMHTYALLKIEEVPRYLGCTILNPRAVMDVLVLGPPLPFPRPLSEIATRDELTTWLTRLLFNTFIQGRVRPPPWNTRLPHNLVAFFGILMYLHRVGYPSLWLSDFLARVLSGRMVSDIPPFTGEYPIPVRERNRRVSSRTVRTDPWLVEFETIISTAYYANPFPVAHALPADFSRDPEDIALWEVPVQPSGQFMMGRGYHANPYEPRAQLLFYRSDQLSATEVIRDMYAVFEGKPTPAQGSFFVLTAPEDIMYLKKVKFHLSKRRMERMRLERWSMVAYRNDTGVQGTLPVLVSSCVQVAKS